jgi:hypothetical protein
MKKIYLRYLALTTTVHGSDIQHSAVNQNVKRLLEVIALSHAQNRPLTVSAAIALMPVADPHTPHRKLKPLHWLLLATEFRNWLHAFRLNR